MTAAQRRTRGTANFTDIEKVEWRAYQQSCELSVPALTNFLVGLVGLQMTAVGAGLADGRPVRSWQSGEAKPRPTTLDRLRLLFRVTSIVDTLYGAEAARAFLRSASPYLGNRAPLESIADDDLDTAQQEVLAAVRGFVEA